MNVCEQLGIMAIGRLGSQGKGRFGDMRWISSLTLDAGACEALAKLWR